MERNAKERLNDFRRRKFCSDACRYGTAKYRRKTGYRVWTPEEQEALEAMLASDVPPKVIAKRLVRSLKSVRKQILRRGLSKKTRWKSGEFQRKVLVRIRFGMDDSEIADDLDCPKSSVHRVRKRFHLPPKYTPSERARMANDAKWAVHRLLKARSLAAGDNQGLGSPGSPVLKGSEG